MKLFRYLIPLLFILPAYGQNVRFDYTAETVTGTGQFIPILAIPGAPISFYVGCTSLPCSTSASTFTTASGSACPANAQVTVPLSSTCVATADKQGNFGAWMAAGTYQYTITVSGVVYGPYQFTTGGGGSGNPGGALYSTQFNGGSGNFVGSLQTVDESIVVGSTVAARVNYAATTVCGSNPCHIIIPQGEAAGSAWTTPLPNTVTLSDQRYTNGQGFAFGTTNIREGEQRTAYYGANLPFESGVNDGRFLLDLETDSYAGTSPANGGGLQIFTERTGGSRPIWSANFNTQVSNLNSTSVGLEMDTVNNSGADDTSDTMNALQIEASGANASGTAIFIGQGGGSWEDAVGIFSYHRTGIVLHPLSGRNSDFSIVPPADDSNLEMIGRNAANSTNVWTMDDSGNLNTTGHVQGNFIFGVNFGQIGPVYLGTGPTSSGLGLVWNTTGGQGESDFVNNHGSGGGGFNWYNSATSSPGSPIMQLDSTGKLVANIFNATTGFQIGGAAPNAHCLVGNGTNYVDNTCPGGSSGISGLTAGFIPKAGSATTITSNSAIDDGVTTAGTVTSTEPIVVNCASCPSQADLTYNTGHAPVPPSATSASFAPDTSGHATFSEAGAAYSRVCTAANGVCASGGVTFPWSCQPGLGDGTNAITGATYPQSTCRNDTGQTVTITGIRCFSDNNGTSTMNVSGHTAGALLTGAVTCTNTYAAGTQSGTTTIAAGDWLVFSFIPDGTTKQTVADVVGTHP